MAGFYIKRIIARSDLKEDAIVDFTSGLNIIQGRSIQKVLRPKVYGVRVRWKLR